MGDVLVFNNARRPMSNVLLSPWRREQLQDELAQILRATWRPNQYERQLLVDALNNLTDAQIKAAYVLAKDPHVCPTVPTIRRFISQLAGCAP